MIKKIILCYFLFLTIAQPTWSDSNFLDKVRTRLEYQITTNRFEKRFVCQAEPICGLQIIPIFYQNRQYQPVWFDLNGLRPTVQSLMKMIRQCDEEGLRPADYHLEALDQLLRQLLNKDFPPAASAVPHWADLDLMLTDAFLLFSAHLSNGRINPETLHTDWLVNERSVDLLSLLNSALTREHLEKAVTRLIPDHQGYKGLKAGLQKMRTLLARKGEWPIIEGTESLQAGDQDARVMAIRKHLVMTGDLGEQPQFSQSQTLFDDALVQAVRNYQKRHGLNPDGIVGRKTRVTMNVSLAKRIRQIELNLERWRWLPRQLGNRYIMVNTAGFNLDIVENGQKVLTMPVVVGRPARQTPVFSTIMSYLVLNPYWTIPPTIAVEDILPILVHDGIDYLSQQHIKVFANWDEDTPEIDPQTIPWQDYGKSHFPVRLRQEPGGQNALGRIKFIFPNKFSVYLHDTPQRDLFSRVQRDFSSGCIRLQDAPALAAYLLSDDPQWTAEKIQTVLKQAHPQIVHIPRPIAVHLLYMTAWVDEKNHLQFRNDIYKRDRVLNTALLKRTPYPLPAIDLKSAITNPNQSIEMVSKPSIGPEIKTNSRFKPDQ